MRKNNANMLDCCVLKIKSIFLCRVETKLRNTQPFKLTVCASRPVHRKNGFVTATKLGTTTKIFVAPTKNFAAATKRFFNRTEQFVVLTKKMLSLF